MSGTQELTRRIKSIKSTRKVTRAMQMVSASKMRKAQAQAIGSRMYADLALELIQSLTGVIPTHEPESRLIRLDAGSEPGMTQLFAGNPKASKIAVIIISTNKGLVGSFNINLLAELRELERAHEGKSVEIITLGKKVSEAAGRLKKNIVAEFPKSDGGEALQLVYPVASIASKLYQTGEYAGVYVVYNQFVSTLTQKAVTKRLLPFEHRNSTAPNPPAGGRGINANSGDGGIVDSDYLIEPSAEEVMQKLVPKIIESQLYQALLESDASEHSSRMIMMKNATDSAGDLIADLTLTFNQLRQNKITTELAEITAGRISLEG